MSNYEFWDELGNIFEAVVAYQEKTIEFNKRFINPWIRLGNVFDKQDRNNEAIDAYRKAIEIDPGNAQNWFELGNAYFNARSYEEAINAYKKAIELNPAHGWSYSNLALSLVERGEFQTAVPLYRKSIELLQEAKDKAMSWNRLGNAYRKLNDYDNAIQAFAKADELDAENSGFRDELDEVSEGPSIVEGGQAMNSHPNVDQLNLSAKRVIVETPVEESTTRDVVLENNPTRDDSSLMVKVELERSQSGQFLPCLRALLQDLLHDLIP